MTGKAKNIDRRISEFQRVGCFFLILLTNLTIFPLLIIMTLAGIIISSPAFVIIKIILHWSTERIIRFFVWCYGRGWLAITFPFVRFKSEGIKNGGLVPPCIIVVNHLSFFDTFFMGALPFYDVVFALRAWPFKMFWYAPFMRLARYFDVESMSWQKISEAGKNALEKGGTLLFYPEAHRSRDGELGRFFSGAFKMAVETGVKLIPLCITGTDVFIPPTRWWMKPARVHLRALPAIDPNEFSGQTSHIQLRKFVKRLMSENIESMRKEEI
ncbi:MAG: 1-acyl-sn-glycerol-3-phosphate acyltransferase [Deltaproteobacteria bacterium]|nr:1-acyl-sn-glycerol-3-phosphate acyltransferase [Deltaproteobacteria bacterium]